MRADGDKKILGLSLIGGISGDMAVGALLDLGLPLGTLKRQLAKVALRGYALSKRTVERGHVRAIKFDVSVTKNKNFSYREIRRLIRSSRLDEVVKRRALQIYETLAQAEIRAHGHAHRDIRFEQLGDVDTVVDILSISIGLEELGIGRVVYGPVPLHAKVSPATRQLLTGKEVYFTGRVFENVTPTGMAFLAAQGTQVRGAGMPAAVVESSGHGAGAQDLPGFANVLGAWIVAPDAAVDAEEVVTVETNIDDMNPQFFDHVFDLLLDAGALDVSVSAVQTKKNRPGFLLRVLSKEENLGKISALILRETTSIGVRFYSARRIVLNRVTRAVSCGGRRIRVKGARTASGRWRWQPEYDDCKKTAMSLKMPIAEVHAEAKKKAEKTWPSPD